MSELPSTRERLLSAAEHLYARHGFDGTSLRELTTAAGVNLAAVNYHFGSKRELLMEMSRRIVEPLNEERLVLLGRAREAAAGAPLSLETICDALLLPLIPYACIDGRPNTDFLRMIGRFIAESEEFYQAVTEEFFKEIGSVFMGELSRTLPNLPPEELQLRFHFALSSCLGTLAQYHMLDRRECAEMGRIDIPALLLRLRDFICAGLRAAPAAGGKGAA